jgi:hypothetical protein
MSTPADYVIPELEHLLAIAQCELDRHLSDHGYCIWCLQLWPCPTACLAEATLAGL